MTAGVGWDDLALFGFAAALGHSGLWMIWRGWFQPGVIVTASAAVVLAAFLGSLPDEPQQEEQKP